MSRCIYCNKDTQTYIMVKSSKKDNAKEYPCCSLKCFNKAESFFKYNNIAMWIFIAIILLLLITIFLELKGIARGALSILAIIVGLFFVAFPYNTKHNFEWWSIKETKKIARFAGIPFILMGITQILFK